MSRRNNLYRAQVVRVVRVVAAAAHTGGPALLAVLALVIGLLITQAAWSSCPSHPAAGAWCGDPTTVQSAKGF